MRLQEVCSNQIWVLFPKKQSLVAVQTGPVQYRHMKWHSNRLWPLCPWRPISPILLDQNRVIGHAITRSMFQPDLGSIPQNSQRVASCNSAGILLPSYSLGSPTHQPIKSNVCIISRTWILRNLMSEKCLLHCTLGIEIEYKFLNITLRHVRSCIAVLPLNADEDNEVDRLA